MSFSTQSFQLGTAARLQGTAPGSSARSIRSTTVQRIQAPSVYGGAGGYGTRVSSSSVRRHSSGGAFYSNFSDNDLLLSGNEKSTMQNLNDRLAAYLERVRSLEKANSLLEKQIKEWHEKNTGGIRRDYSSYFQTIEDLQNKVRSCTAIHNNMNCKITICCGKAAVSSWNCLTWNRKCLMLAGYKLVTDFLMFKTHSVSFVSSATTASSLSNHSFSDQCCTDGKCKACPAD